LTESAIHFGKRARTAIVIFLHLTGDAIDAHTAADWGLVNRVVAADQLDATCLDLIQRCTRGPRASKASGKQGFYEQMESTQEQAYAMAMKRMIDGALTHEAQQSFQPFGLSEGLPPLLMPGAGAKL
jgi:enoyl-CoA hydratase/carnithine racemase